MISLEVGEPTLQRKIKDFEINDECLKTKLNINIFSDYIILI